MAYGVLQASKSYRQLWRRSSTRTSPAGRGRASLVLGSDAVDEVMPMRVGDRIEVGTAGAFTANRYIGLRGDIRINEHLPEGYGWRVTFNVDGYLRQFDILESDYSGVSTPFEVTVDDTNINVTGLTGVAVLSLALELILDPGSTAGSASADLAVTLPSIYFDQIGAPTTISSELYVENRVPPPGQNSVPVAYPTINFTLADANGAGVDLANTTVTVDGVTAYTGGSFVGPWTGTVTPGTGPTTSDVDFSLTVPAANLPYASEQAVTVTVASQLTGPISPITTHWSFLAADITPPVMRTATMLDKKTIRVVFTDDLQLDATADGALNPANYAITRVSAPAATLTPISVAVVQNTYASVDITVDTEASVGANYLLLAKDIKDHHGNPLSSIGNAVEFVGFSPTRPAGRRFDLLDFISAENLRADSPSATGSTGSTPGSGDLHRFMLVLQDVVDILLCSIDEWTNIIDIDLAPEAFLDAILQDLGNPFEECISDLTLIDKRRLARLLVSIYKQKGTTPGVINAIRFFLGVEVTLDIINFREYWSLGESELDVDTILAPPVGSGLWYSFYVVSPIVLTAEQRSRALCIAQYMKGANEHVLGILEPGDQITPSPYWTLNLSLLGADPTVDPSTILA